MEKYIKCRVVPANDDFKGNIPIYVSVNGKDSFITPYREVYLTPEQIKALQGAVEMRYDPVNKTHTVAYRFVVEILEDDIVGGEVAKAESRRGRKKAEPSDENVEEI